MIPSWIAAIAATMAGRRQGLSCIARIAPYAGIV
jgi:hypothetical protein